MVFRLHFLNKTFIQSHKTQNHGTKKNDKKVHDSVYDFSPQKIPLVCKDSAQIFVNLKASIKADELFQFGTFKFNA